MEVNKFFRYLTCCERLKDYETKENGSRSLHLCTICNKSFSETKGSFLTGLKKPINLIVEVFKARTDGLSFNSTYRVFNIAKNTLLDWKRKFQDLKPTFLMYSIHLFLLKL